MTSRSRTFVLGPRTAVELAASVVGLVLLFDLVQNARHALTWLVLGTLFAMALDPLVQGLSRRTRLGQGSAVAVVALVATAVVLSAVSLLAPIAAREAGKFSEEVPRVIDRLGELPVIGGTLTRQHVPQRLRDWATRLPEQLNQNDAPVVGLFQSAVGGFLAASAVVSLTAAMLLDGRRLLDAVRRAVPAARRPLFDTSAHILYRTVGRYFAGSLLVSLLAATGVLIVGLLVGIPLAPLVAVWVSVTNLIPQIGGFLGGAAFVLTGLSAGPTAGAICLVYFLAYQQLENHVISPLVVGEAVDLSPAVTMIGALVGAATAGVPGALVAVPLIGTVKAVFSEVRGYRGRSPNDAGSHAHGGRNGRSSRPSGLLARVRRMGASHR